MAPRRRRRPRGARRRTAGLADRETALGVARLAGEVARTAGQLRFYGDVAAEGSYLGVHDRRRPPTTTPGWSGSTAPSGPSPCSARATSRSRSACSATTPARRWPRAARWSCKAHPAHPGSQQRQAEIAQDALAAAGAPEGTFDVVVGQQAGVDLVKAPEVAAVAFTGSQARWSRAVAARQRARGRDPGLRRDGHRQPGRRDPRPAPRDIAEIAAGFVGSFTLGNGQFCTKPGLLLAPAGSGAARPGRRSAARRRLRAGHAHRADRRSGRAPASRSSRAAGAELVAPVPARRERLVRPRCRARGRLSALSPAAACWRSASAPSSSCAEYADRRRTRGRSGDAPGLAGREPSSPATTGDTQAAVAAGGAEPQGRPRHRQRLAHRRRLHVGAAPRRAMALHVCTGCYLGRRPWPGPLRPARRLPVADDVLAARRGASGQPVAASSPRQRHAAPTAGAELVTRPARGRPRRGLQPRPRRPAGHGNARRPRRRPSSRSSGPA